VTVTGAFSSAYDNYKITYTNGLGSVSGIGINMQLGSLVIGYYSGIANVNYFTNAVTGIGQDNNVIWNNVGGIGTAGFTMLDCDVFSPFLARWTFFQSKAVHYGLNFGSGSGLNTSGTSETAFTLSPASGTFTGGTIRVYGYRN
jgi:hypothetical protein